MRAFEGARPMKRKARTDARSPEPRFVAALMMMVCAAEPLFGDMSRRSVGLASGRASTRRFRNWFAAAVADLLDPSA